MINILVACGAPAETGSSPAVTPTAPTSAAQETISPTQLSAFTIDPDLGYYQWIKMDSDEEWEGARDHCTVEYLQTQLAHLENITVVSVEINDTGSYTLGKEEPEENLPAYCEIKIEELQDDGKINTIMVYLPLVWNQRFLGLPGGGTYTYLYYKYYLYGPSVAWPVGIRNYFACAYCDGCNPAYDMEWGYVGDTDELDWDMLDGWSHGYHHSMKNVADEVCKAVYGEYPAYSYMGGVSGGGRSSVGQMSRYPDDYDGIYAFCPGLRWFELHLSMAWPYMVMKYGHEVPAEKLQIFNQAVLEQYGVTDGYIEELFPEFDPYTLVGMETPVGPITEEDAETVQKIWNGPTRANGERMFESVLGPLPQITVPSGGQYFDQANQVLGWVSGNPDFSVEEITLEEYEALYDMSVAQFSDIDYVLDPKLDAYKNSGGKAILGHCSGDNLVPATSTLNYYQSVVDYFGSEDEVNTFMQLYLTPGGETHSSKITHGKTIVVSYAFAALMNWVENGIVPTGIQTSTYNFETNQVEYTDTVAAPYHLGQ